MNLLKLIFRFGIHRDVSLNSAIPVRFSHDITDRLKAVSENTGIPVSQLVRTATEQYLQQIESSRTVTVALKEKAITYKTSRSQKLKSP